MKKLNLFPFKNKVIKKIIEKYQTLWALGYLSALAGWDLHTYMPRQGAEERGVMFAKISTLIEKLITDKGFVRLINKAQQEDDLNDYEKAVIKNIKRSLRIYQKIPRSLLEKSARLTNKAQIVWQRARQENNNQLFIPYLEKLVIIARQKAEYLGYKNHPYDALLNLYEEGWTTKEVENFFDQITPPLKNLLQKVIHKKGYVGNHPLTNLQYNKNVLEKINKKILRFFQADLDRLRMDVSAHPFTQYIGYDDTRITTRYEGTNFASSILSTVHEFGHALHHMQCDHWLAKTPAGNLESLGMGESQSRFFENFIGKSREFIKIFYPDLLKLHPTMKKYSPEDIYNYFNLVRPNLIRVNADEISYHLHIKIRFEVEKALIENSLKVTAIPQYWRAKMKEYLGIVPKKDRDGFLQDVHWSMGSFGYFPTYSLGTFLSGIWKKSLEKDLGKINRLINKKNIGRIENWLKEKIHRYGGVYSTKQIVKRVYQKPFSPQPLLDYLEKKYSP